MTITEFLLARIAEDEEVASLVHSSVAEYHVGWTADGMASHDSAALGALWNGDRVLAECEAKRKVIDAAWSDHVRIEGEWGMGQSCEQMDAKGDVPDVLVHLAAVYASHSDYRDEWRP